MQCRAACSCPAFFTFCSAEADTVLPRGAVLDLPEGLDKVAKTKYNKIS